MVEYPLRALLQGPDGSIWKFDKDRNWVWSYSTGEAVYCVKVDAEGYVYAAGLRYGLKNVWKLDSEGVEQWSVMYGSYIKDIAIDSNGDVFIVGPSFGGNSLWKLDGSDGSELWKIDAGWSVNCVAVDSSDDVFVGFMHTYFEAGDSIHKYSGVNGASLASVDTGEIIIDLAIDGSDNVIAVGLVNSSSKLAWKYNNVLDALAWSIPDTVLDAAWSVAIDGSDNVYIGGIFGAYFGFFKFNSSGVKQWTHHTDSPASGIAVDKADNIYAVGARNYYGEMFWKVDDGGNSIWSFKPFPNKLTARGPAVEDFGAIESVAAAPTAGGTGYLVDDILDISEGNNGQVKVTAVDAGVVTAVALEAPGDDYTTGTGKATTGGTGSGCTIEITDLVFNFYLLTTDFGTA